MPYLAMQSLFKVHSIPLMVSLSNHERLEPASFDKLRMSGRQWMCYIAKALIAMTKGFTRSLDPWP